MHTVGDLIDHYADRHGWIIDWKRGTVRMPKRHARYAYPILKAADRVARIVRLHGGTFWAIALAAVCIDAAAHGNLFNALLSALLFGVRAEQQLHPKARYSA